MVLCGVVLCERCGEVFEGSEPLCGGRVLVVVRMMAGQLGRLVTTTGQSQGGRTGTNIIKHRAVLSSISNSIIILILSTSIILTLVCALHIRTVLTTNNLIIICQLICIFKIHRVLGLIVKNILKYFLKNISSVCSDILTGG